MEMQTDYSAILAEHQTRIEVTGDTVSLHLPSGPETLPKVKLPDHLVQWIKMGRQSVYDQILENSDKIRFFSQHLPVLVTYSANSLFPFNCGNKGVGFLPTSKALESYNDLYERTIEASRGIPWQDSLPARIQTASKFNEDHGGIDYRCLASLEIFQKTTFKNLLRFPLASLLYTGTSPTYTSFQLNCAVEIIDENDPRFTFIKLSRTLFEFDGFHIAQPQFQYGYIFWITEVIDKTPHRVPDIARKDGSLSAGTAPAWDHDAALLLQNIPGMNRLHIRHQIERYAKERGFKNITSAVMQEARKVLFRKQVSK